MTDEEEAPSTLLEWGPMLSIPNLFTFLRALLVPVILVLLVQGDDVSRWWAFGIFTFAAWTDSVDGWVARRWSSVTRWGQLADPIADKLLVGGALVSLALVGDLPWFAVAVILARELGVTVLRVTMIRRHEIIMAASAWGKVKTISQIVAVGAFLIPPFPESVALGLLWGAVLLTVWSGIEYGFRAGRMVRASASERAALAADGTAADVVEDGGA
ncbi:MAG: CDP-diacylglycerol--glycerol-3-phosphate 3-phosphatidyltransferase [Nitriliruptorales bacterium]|nr:CDP-diacylglycerol--glycerol-3-phosphate 3-phosphatidyltransferase [Nitriliruptorales bacterium]